MRALVVEDNPKMAAAIQRGLRENGYAVDVSGTGFEGEDLAAGGQYDVIILDLMLPDRDGVEVCRNLRRRCVKTPISSLLLRPPVFVISPGLPPATPKCGAISA